MLRSEAFFTEESAIRKIEQLRAQGKNFDVDEMIDYGTICEGLSISFIQITWED